MSTKLFMTIHKIHGQFTVQTYGQGRVKKTWIA